MQGAGWKAAVMAAVLSFFLTTVAAHDVTFPTVAPPFFLEAASGRLTTAAAPAAAARGSRVIFFNEFPDSEDCHAAEYDILQALYAQYGDRLVLSMEMFERDVQPAVDAFLHGETDEAEFLSATRPWPNYDRDYSAIVRFAKVHRLPLLAANIPRRIAAVYARTGSLAELAEKERAYLPLVRRKGSAAYAAKFTAVMNRIGQVGMKVEEDRIPLLYQAQCLKDDTMAETLSAYGTAHPQAIIYHLQGAFHGEEGLGVIEKLHQLQPAWRLTAITAVRKGEGDNADVLQRYRSYGDYLFIN